MTAKMRKSLEPFFILLSKEIYSFLVSATYLRQGNIFTTVRHSVHREVYPSMHWGRHPLADTPPGQTHPQADTPWADTPLGRHPPGRRLLLRTVHILLECILVSGCMLSPNSMEAGPNVSCFDCWFSSSDSTLGFRRMSFF